MEGDKRKSGITDVDVGGEYNYNGKFEEKTVSGDRNKQHEEKEVSKDTEIRSTVVEGPDVADNGGGTEGIDERFLSSFGDLTLPPFESLTSSYADEIDLPLDYRNKECPICMLPLPTSETKSSYRSCCGQLICSGCEMKHARSDAIEHVKRSFANVQMEQGSVDKVNLEATLLNPQTYNQLAKCAFCRTELDTQNMIRRLQNRIDSYNDSIAMTQLGSYCLEGTWGATKDIAKGIDLISRAWFEGDPTALCYIADFYRHGRHGFEKDLNKTVFFLLVALIHKGYPQASVELMAIFLQSDLPQPAMFAARLAARFGFTVANDIILHGYKEGWVSKEECAKSLREYQKAKSEMESPERTEHENMNKDPIKVRTKQKLEMAKLVGDLKAKAAGGRQQQRGVDHREMKKGVATKSI